MFSFKSLNRSFTLLLVIFIFLTWCLSFYLWLSFNDLEKSYFKNALTSELNKANTAIASAYSSYGRYDTAETTTPPFKIHLTESATVAGTCEPLPLEVKSIEEDGVKTLYIQQNLKLIPKIYPDTKHISQAGCLHIKVSASKDDLQSIHKKISYYKNIAACIPLIQLLIGFYCVYIFRKQFKRLNNDLDSIQSGKIEKIEVDSYINEFEPMLTLLNSELSRIKILQSIIKNRVRDYAHAINSPLTVLFDLCKQYLPEKTLELTDQLIATISNIRDRYVRRMIIKRNDSDNDPIVLELLYNLHAFQFKSLLDINNVEWIIKGSSDITVNADADDLEEAISNLIDNCIKYGESKIETSITVDNNTVNIITDNDGEAPELDQMNLLKQTGGQLDEKYVGYGLGIKSVANIAFLYNGTLNFDNSPLGGLRVTLSLPAGNPPNKDI
jgi:signal transduction histidine kinase